MQARALVEARVDADRLRMATQSALAADGDLLGEEVLAHIGAAMSQLKALEAGTDAAAIEAACKALAAATEGFAAQRMNRGIAQALSGKNVAAL
jgi:molecular chaperone HscA